MQKTYRKSELPKIMVKSAAVSWMITLIGTSVTALLLHTETINEKGIAPATVIIMMLAAFAAAFAAGQKGEGNKLLRCLMGGGIYYGSLLLCNAVIFGGKYTGILAALLTVAGCCLITGLLLSRQKRQRPSYLKRLPKI